MTPPVDSPRQRALGLQVQVTANADFSYIRTGGPPVTSCHIEISLSKQVLSHHSTAGTIDFAISSAANGAGQRSGSECTPLGRHVVRARIGAGEPRGAVFVGRRPTGEIYSPELAEQFPERDWILTRILWLSGLERGLNRLGNVDSMRRYIYIHGTPETEPMGQPASHGCIRMHNDAVIALFDRTPVGTQVSIVP